LIGIPIHFEAGHHRFAQGQVGRVMQQLQHLPGVMAFVGLGTQGPNGRAAAGVQDPLLNGGGISEAADHATKGIHFMHKLAFGRTANGRIAGLPGDAVEIEGEQGGVEPQTSSRDCSLTTGMTTPDDDHVEAFGGGRTVEI